MSAGPKGAPPQPTPPHKASATPSAPARRAVIGGQDKISERIAAAAEELASGLTEAAAAAEQLRSSMGQIASGAEEAAGGSQEQLAAIKLVVADLTTARAQAEVSRRRTEAVQLVLAEMGGADRGLGAGDRTKRRSPGRLDRDHQRTQPPRPRRG
jgi:methyl-accepting chemotaxis protein